MIVLQAFEERRTLLPGFTSDSSDTETMLYTELKFGFHSSRLEAIWPHNEVIREWGICVCDMKLLERNIVQVLLLSLF